MTTKTQAIDNIVRPLVEGKVRGFLKDHPSIISGIDWFKTKATREDVFVDSVSKRILGDLTCEQTIARLSDVLSADPDKGFSDEAAAIHSEASGDPASMRTGRVISPHKEETK